MRCHVTNQAISVSQRAWVTDFPQDSDMGSTVLQKKFKEAQQLGNEMGCKYPWLLL